MPTANGGALSACLGAHRQSNCGREVTRVGSNQSNLRKGEGDELRQRVRLEREGGARKYPFASPKPTMVCFVNVASVDRIIYSILQRFNLEWKNRTLKLFTQAA